jgi:hypothetical protein
VASAAINTGTQLGGSIGTALLNTIFDSAITADLTAHVGPGTLVQGRPSPELIALAQVHGYTTVFSWCAAIFTGGAIVCDALLRSGPLTRPGEAFQPSAANQATPTANTSGLEGPP